LHVEPLWRGRCNSRTTQPAVLSIGVFKNSAAEAHIRTVWPAAPRSRAMAFRCDSSSSTT
jgi:hypothetical protein